MITSIFKTFEGKCPHCKSDNIRDVRTIIEGDSATKVIYCKDCKRQIPLWSRLNWEYKEEVTKNE